MADKITILFCLAVACTLLVLVTGDRGCPDNQAECETYCGGPGEGKCERSWYRWRLRSRCHCDPCRGERVLGLCITSVGVTGGCDHNGQNCQVGPTGTTQK
ncbi:uncharacterized protein LOC110845161 [Folsomia candida]|uniref:uncharacterized protein LOC110845161 n=1 Tax=Folsomia candida TaxID=158441 RepID=UPI000B901FD1|nr:uncharacterized protein LOC110845161 [Folsomia candida]